MADWEDYYKILGVDPKATAEDIRKAYRDLVNALHPDHFKGAPGVANEKTKELNRAYGVLSNPAKRRAYDKDCQARKGKPDPHYDGGDGSPRPKVYNPIIEVDRESIIVNTKEGQPARFSFVVKHISGEFPPAWSLGVKIDGTFLADAQFELDPLNSFPIRVTVILAPQKRGDYEGSLEMSIVEKV